MEIAKNEVLQVNNDEFAVAGPSSAYYNAYVAQGTSVGVNEDSNDEEPDDESTWDGDGGLYMCGLCCIGFKSKPDLDNHFQSIHDRIKPIACSSETVTKATLAHAQNCVSRQQSLAASTSARTRGNQCVDNLFARNPMVMLRRLEHMDEKPYPCNNLEKGFKIQPELIGQKSNHTCNACGKRFQTEVDLKIHMASHYGGIQAIEQCKHGFKTKAELIRHIRTHTGEKPYSCDECPKQFRIKGGLTIHKLRHQSTKNWHHCEECGIKFAAKADFTRHTQTHIDEKPYVCDECAKEFITKLELTIHIRHHTGEKPYACPKCEKAFIIKAELALHIRTHADEKSYVCQKCGKAFNTEVEVTQHKRTRIGCKQYRCEDCGQRFRTKSEISKHTRTHASAVK